MHRLRLFALICCALLPSACRERDRSGVCNPIKTATRVVVQWSHSITQSDGLITDPVRIHDLTAFANARRDASRPSLYTMPAPQVTAAFYDGDHFLGGIGAGQNFLFVSCAAWSGIRDATPAELETFKGLISSAAPSPKPKP